MATAITTCLFSRNPLLSAILTDYFAKDPRIALMACRDAEPPTGCDLWLVDGTHPLPASPEAPPVLVLGEANLSPAQTLAKPFRLPQLREAILTFAASASTAHMLGGRYRFLPAKRRIEDMEQNNSLTLTEKETHILAALCTQVEGLARDALLQQVWGYGDDIDTRTLETHIHRLRQKLESFSDRRLSIRTESGGYRLAI